MRVLVTGMGGELGTRVVNLLEADDTFTDIVGIDGYPPRRRITRAVFHRVDHRDRRKAVHVVREFDPEVILHLSVYEPNAQFGPTEARLATMASAVSVLGAAASCPSLQGIVVLSGIEVYGRRRGAPSRPDESADIDPTSPFGASLAHVEQVAGEASQVVGVPVTSLRFGPIVGPSLPSPLGRYLRLPAVATSPLMGLPFCLTHQEDAALAIVSAGQVRFDGPLNVVGPGAVTASQAVRRGGRMAIPVIGPGWRLAAITAELLGAPLPPHTRELLVRGGVADGTLATDVLGVHPRPTDDVLAQLYQWGQVARVAPTSRGAAA